MRVLKISKCMSSNQMFDFPAWTDFYLPLFVKFSALLFFHE
jgi:hypothetical protein